jgi:hypothetical protein
MPEMAVSMEMQTLLDTEVLPMYDVLDSLTTKNSSPVQVKGSSLRNLLGQALLREVQSSSLAELIKMNNNKAMQEGKPQYVFLLDGRDAVQWPQYVGKAAALQGNPKLTPFQATNLELNLQLVEMESIRNEKEGTSDDDDFVDNVFS